MLQQTGMGVQEQGMVLTDAERDPHLCVELQCTFSQALSELSSSAVSQQHLIIPHLL